MKSNYFIVIALLLCNSAHADLVPVSCLAIKNAMPSAPSGNYLIDPDGSGSEPAFYVHCDMTTQGGGWTIIFNSANPALWRTNTGTPGTGEWSQDFSSINYPINEIMLYDVSGNRYQIISGINLSGLYQCIAGNDGKYWNGTLDGTFSALHLGIHTTETKRPVGYVIVSHGCITDTLGWGFGHLAYQDDQQGWGWDSNNLGSTVFAIGIRYLSNTYTLQIAKIGLGSGSITSNPAGINCGAVCAANFAENTAVTLTATPAAGSAFGGWSSNCAVGQVNMTADTTCTATFNLLPKPDFTIPVMTIAPAVPVTNGTFTATVTVKNQGTVAADGGQLRLWANQTTAPACAATGGDKNVAVGTIAAGVSKTFTITGLNAGVSGPKTLRAFVDATCAKVESNETNNQRTLNYRVAGRKPDLVITNITLTPASPARNAVFNAAITVKNQGTAVSGSSFLDVWTNQTTAATCGAVGNAWADVGALVAGASKVINVTGLSAGATAGAKTLRAFVDSWCETAESNEANNQLSKSYTVQ